MTETTVAQAKACSAKPVCAEAASAQSNKRRRIPYPRSSGCHTGPVPSLGQSVPLYDSSQASGALLQPALLGRKLEFAGRGRRRRLAGDLL